MIVEIGLTKFHIILYLKSAQAFKTAERHLFFGHKVRGVKQFYQLFLDSTFHISQTLFNWVLWVMSGAVNVSASKVLLAFVMSTNNTNSELIRTLIERAVLVRMFTYFQTVFTEHFTFSKLDPRKIVFPLWKELSYSQSAIVHFRSCRVAANFFGRWLDTIGWFFVLRFFA